MDDTLLLVDELDTMVAQIPVEEAKIQYVKRGNDIKILVPGLEKKLLIGNVDLIGKNAQFLNGKVMFIVRVIIENPENKLMPGMTGNVKIYCDRITVKTFLRRWYRASVGSRFII